MNKTCIKSKALFCEKAHDSSSSLEERNAVLKSQQLASRLTIIRLDYKLCNLFPSAVVQSVNDGYQTGKSQTATAIPVQDFGPFDTSSKLHVSSLSL